MKQGWSLGGPCTLSARCSHFGGDRASWLSLGVSGKRSIDAANKKEQQPHACGEGEVGLSWRSRGPGDINCVNERSISAGNAASLGQVCLAQPFLPFPSQRWTQCQATSSEQHHVKKSFSPSHFRANRGISLV